MSKVPRIITKIFVFSLLAIYCFLVFNFPVYSNTVAELEEQIAQKEQEIQERESTLEAVERRIREIGSSNYTVSQRIALITEEIEDLEKDIEETEVEIEKKVKGIEEKQEELEKTKGLIDEVSGDLYIQSRYKVANFFLSGGNWGSLVESLYIRMSTVSMLKFEAEKIGGEFSSLAESKAELDREKESLDKQREGLDEAHKLLADERARLQAELSRQVASRSGLSSEITDLTKKVSQLQAALIAARSAGLISSGGYTGSENGTSISQAPTGSFGVFSIGAYTHRNGMGQWAARARADAGQTYDQILSFYYPDSVLSSGTMDKITVLFCDDGPNVCFECRGPRTVTYDFETEYLYRLGEMPESFHMEALKAQAISARTYALNATNYGANSVRGDQCGQVIAGMKTGTWKQAVDATREQVLKINGSVFSTQYAAVHGGWVNNVGWDTKSGGGSDWFNDAWERESGVTWFYKSWYRAGWSSAGEACGRSPWISHSEMVDLVNAYLIKHDIGLRATPDKSRLLPSDFGQCPGRLDYGNTTRTPYSSSELKSLLNNPVNTINGVTTSLSNGHTTNVSFSTDRGTIDISGMLFKDIYNQMAPGHMRIQQQAHYAYFNVERAF